MKPESDKKLEGDILRTCDLPEEYQAAFDEALSTLSSLAIEGVRFPKDTLQKILGGTNLNQPLIDMLVGVFKKENDGKF